MTSFNIENTIPSGTYFKRSTGKTGQVIASPEFEAKLSKVEALYLEYHGAVSYTHLRAHETDSYLV